MRAIFFVLLSLSVTAANANANSKCTVTIDPDTSTVYRLEIKPNKRSYADAQGVWQSVPADRYPFGPYVMVVNFASSVLSNKGVDFALETTDGTQIVKLLTSAFSREGEVMGEFTYTGRGAYNDVINMRCTNY